MTKKTPLVSIVIVSFNTKELLQNCIDSIEEYADVPYEIIISDNGSTDGTKDAFVKKQHVKFIQNKDNLGFSKGNNVARQIAQGEYILFLNPDTLLHSEVLSQTISYLKSHTEVGAITCKVVLPSGILDPDTRRSFPTPLVSLTHFAGLDRIFPQSKTFARYWMTFNDENEIQQIDSLQGAYLLSTKKVLNEVGWFDEDYFLDGEDIDLCWKIKNAGYKIIYYPKVKITHIKKGSKSKNRSLRSVIGGVNAMEIFYRKRLWSTYPLLVNLIVISAIKGLKLIRTIKYYL